MLEKIAFVMYPVKDIERARNFYENILGLSVGKISGGGVWVEYDLPGGGCLTITTVAKGVSPSSNSGGSVAFEVSDLDKLVSDLKAKNVEFKLDIFTSPVCRMAIVIDSEGNSIMLHQLKNISI